MELWRFWVSSRRCGLLNNHIATLLTVCVHCCHLDTTVSGTVRETHYEVDVYSLIACVLGESMDMCPGCFCQITRSHK